ncbi:MAG: response regulator transcription factor [Lewinellaceae bacterium]|nr:response regulator transcription factor [Saprospiraceae bacterium]MCB9315152.1 response regulator transcription factor [Lewinellaceae bacterium]MCB9332272.1 response regulator transcription factor [Lewinellaceae bacterium]
MKILLIEDELPAARQLTKLLTAQLPGCTILETLDSVTGAVRWLRSFPAPDLVFMDIQIADGLSLDIFRQVDVAAPVIFTTAFDQYAVQAFKVNAIDYLLKPIDPEDLQKALDRVQERRLAGPVDMQALVNHFQPARYKDRFLVKSGQHMVFIATADIAFFRSSDGLTMAHLFSGKKYFVDHTLDELDTLLDPRQYFRVSRAVTLRIDAIQKIHPHLNGRLKLDTEPDAPEAVYVSRDRAPAFKNWLGG